MRFKSFKRLVKVLLMLLAIDIIGAGFRVSSRWLLQSTMLTIIHYLRILGLTVECWTYGFSHRTVRNTIREFFGLRENRMEGRQENLELQERHCQPPSLPQVGIESER